MLPCSDAAIAAAAHPHELAEAQQQAEAAGEPPAHHLTLDHQMMGIGGDVGWLRSVRERYLLPPGMYRWSVVLNAFTAWPPPPPPPLPADLAAASALASFEPLTRATRCANVVRVVLLEAPPLTRTIVGSLLLLLSWLVVTLASAYA